MAKKSEGSSKGWGLHLNPRNALGKSLTADLTKQQEINLIKSAVAQGRHLAQEMPDKASANNEKISSDD